MSNFEINNSGNISETSSSSLKETEKSGIIYKPNTDSEDSIQINVKNKISNNKIKNFFSFIPQKIHEHNVKHKRDKVLDKFNKKNRNDKTAKMITKSIMAENDIEKLEAKCNFLDKCLEDEMGMIKYDEYFFKRVLIPINSLEESKAKCDSLDFVYKLVYGKSDSVAKTTGFQNVYIADILEQTHNADNVEAQKIMLKKFDKTKKFSEFNLSMNTGFYVANTTTVSDANAKCEFIDKILEYNKTAEKKIDLHEVLYATTCTEDTLARMQVFDKIISTPELFNNPNVMLELSYQAIPEYHIKGGILENLKGSSEKTVLKILDDKTLPPERLGVLLRNSDVLTYSKVKQYQELSGKDFCKYNNDDLAAAIQYVSLYGKKSIDEITRNERKELIKNLVSSNSDLFKLDLKENYPLLPSNQEEYCELLPKLVKSVGIETKPLDNNQIENLNNNINDLATTLKNMSDYKFSELTIKQEYDKDDFVKDVLNKTSKLSQNELQKVLDYYSFELYKNNKNKTKYSLRGYPLNPQDNKNLAQIENKETIEVIKSLEENVQRFTENNKVKCNNKKIEKNLNDIVEMLPELHAVIGRQQHKIHDFDVMQHSLKVMQKIVQSPEFDALSESDKKVMLLASLMHDISKREAEPDHTHFFEGAFDAYFISKKLNLTKTEEHKLYTIIKNHEWLSYINQAKTKEEQTKRMQSVAFDLQRENNAELSIMFTKADLKAVKKDDSFATKTTGDGRVNLDGETKSFLDLANDYGSQVQKYVQELRCSQPILPITQIPKATEIDKYITKVNEDGSTNIKGVYKDKDGLVVIKFNEVEDWEAIGFPKGTKSRGIKTTTNHGDNIDTGNIKFIVHGLEYNNQLSRFDAFSLPDDDALLSVSYTERPESKYRFFRPQGVVLDIDTENIYGGGRTDSGSGCAKDISKFKKDYVFGGRREGERVYIANMIKECTGMSDEEYCDFAEKNKNKSMLEIEPEEVRNKIIKEFAQINSNSRKGSREYNEMYVSNPNRVSAVFAYSIDTHESGTNPIEFLNRDVITPGERRKMVNHDSKSVSERTEFLREYALTHDIPFIVFGN